MSNNYFREPIFYDVHSSNFRLRINRTPSFFATPHGMGHAKLGAGVPTSHPQHPQGLGLAKTFFFSFFWAKNGNLAMAKNGKLIACATPCGPLASCGPHPNGPKCAHGHQGGQGPTPCSPHGHPQIWQPYFQIWGVPHISCVKAIGKATTVPLRGFAGGLEGAVCFPWPTKVHMAIGL